LNLGAECFQEIVESTPSIRQRCFDPLVLKLTDKSVVNDELGTQSPRSARPIPISPSVALLGRDKRVQTRQPPPRNLYILSWADQPEPDFGEAFTAGRAADGQHCTWLASDGPLSER
jgi:hypothetical protein